MGLGVLSFIASNWAGMIKPVKFLTILGIYGAVVLASFKTQAHYPRTSRSLVYLAALTFGAGIFLNGQIFNLGGHFSQAFLWWAVGILPLAVVLKDKWLFIAANGLLFPYLNGHFDLSGLPLAILIAIPVMYWLNRYFQHAKATFFIINLLVINTVLVYLDHFDVAGIYTLLGFFVIGLAMYRLPVSYHPGVFRLQGSLIFGVAGLMLTIRAVWEDISWLLAIIGLTPTSASIALAIVYLLMLLWFIRKGDVISLLFFCLTIFRYYIDTMYDFMPKSVFFILGGLMLLGFGYYFERLRKQGKGGGYFAE